VHAGGEGKEVVARIFVAPTDDADTVRNMGKFARFDRYLGPAP
jgi:hypothetical protein